MDLFLIHCLVLIWTSVTAARRLVRPWADQFLVAAVLAWGNIVATSLLLSTLHRLGEPRWFLATSGLLALLTCGLLLMVKPESVAADVSDPATEPGLNPWLLAAFLAVLAPLAFASLGIAYTYQPNSPDALAYHLPRAMYYLGQNSLAYFDAADLRQVYLPFNYNLLQVFGLVYSPPLQCLNLFNLVAWLVGGIAAFRLCRLCVFGPNVSLVASGLAMIAPTVLVQATAATNSLPAGAALLCALVFGLRWRATRATRDAMLAGLALGLAAGSTLAILCFLPIAAALWWLAARHAAAVPGSRDHRIWIMPVLLAVVLASPFALINLTGKNHGLHPSQLLLDRAFSFTGAGQTMQAFLAGLETNQVTMELNENQVGFGFTGLLFLGCAGVCLIRDRKISRPAVWFAGLGAGWIACYCLLQPASVSPADFVPALLVMTPCVAAVLIDISVQRPVLRHGGSLVVLCVALAAVWSDGTYLLSNFSRPFSPLLNAAFAPPALSTLPLLMELRMSGQTRINIDTDGVNESIFPFMAQGHGQRFTSRGETDPNAYNILSRSRLSRNAAYRKLDLLSSYILLPIPSKRSAGVEFLATIGNDDGARDYFGLVPQPGRVGPIDGNRSLLLTFYHEPGQDGNEARTRLKLAGLNPEDHVRVAGVVEYNDGSTAPIATFSANGETAFSIARPFYRLLFTAQDTTSGVPLGTATMPYLSEAAEKSVPVDPRRPTNARSLFVTDVVLATNANVVADEGLMPVEGPFPQWGIPYIRWARQPTVTIKIPPIHQLGSMQVSFSVRSHVREKADLAVVFNDRIVQLYHLNGKSQWLDQTLELTPQHGENVLEFRDATYKTEPDWLDYLQRYPDVKTYLLAQKIPLESGAKKHYETNGRSEGRTVLLRATGELEPPPDSYYYMYRNIRLEGFKAP